VGQLLQFLKSQRGHLIVAHASEVDLLRTMECCPPAAYQYPPAVEEVAKTEEVVTDAQGEAAGDAGADTVVNAGGGDGTSEEKEEVREVPKLVLQGIDVSSVGRFIDYSDFLDMLCRVIFSDWWTYTAVTDSNELVEGETSEVISSSSVPPPSMDSSQNMTTEELLYSRLLTFSLTFNVDELTSTRI